MRSEVVVAWELHSPLPASSILRVRKCAGPWVCQRAAKCPCPWSPSLNQRAPARHQCWCSRRSRKALICKQSGSETGLLEGCINGHIDIRSGRDRSARVEVGRKRAAGSFFPQ